MNTTQTQPCRACTLEADMLASREDETLSAGERYELQADIRGDLSRAQHTCEESREVCVSAGGVREVAVVRRASGATVGTANFAGKMRTVRRQAGLCVVWKEAPEVRWTAPNRLEVYADEQLVATARLSQGLNALEIDTRILGSCSGAQQSVAFQAIREAVEAGHPTEGLSFWTRGA
jgi:hypothetical protein